MKKLAVNTRHMGRKASRKARVASDHRGFMQTPVQTAIYSADRSLNGGGPLPARKSRTGRSRAVQMQREKCPRCIAKDILTPTAVLVKQLHCQLLASAVSLVRG